MGFLDRRHLKRAQKEYMAAALEVEAIERELAGNAAARKGSSRNRDTLSDARLSSARQRLVFAEMAYTSELIINNVRLPPDLMAKNQGQKEWGT